MTDLHLTPGPVAESEKVYRGAIDWWDRTFNRPHQVLPKVLAEIRDANVDFGFFGGDNIDCYHPATAERVIKLARDYGLNTYFQSGNHDWETLHIRYVTHDYDATWRATALQKLVLHWNMPAPYYSFEKKGVRFIAGHAHIRSEDALGQTCQFMTAPASDGQWRYVKVGNADPPKSLRASGFPDLPLRSH